MKRKRLIEEREKRGLTSEQLAKEIGISKAMVSHIETGRHWPSGKVIIRLERFFGLPASELLAVEDNYPGSGIAIKGEE